MKNGTSEGRGGKRDGAGAKAKTASGQPGREWRRLLDEGEAEILAGVLAILRTPGDAQNSGSVGALIQHLVYAVQSAEYQAGQPVSIYHQEGHGWDYRAGSDFAQGADDCYYPLVLQKSRAVVVAP